MEDFQDHGTPPNQLEKLNVCWMYLQVTMLAEITDQTGTLLLPQILAGPQNPTPKGLVNISMSILKWLTIALPTSTCWRLWDKTICTLYMGSPTRMKLQQPLGMWQPTYNQQRFWHWQMEDPDHLVFCFSPTAPMRVVIPVICRQTTLSSLPLFLHSAHSTAPQ